MRIAIDFTPASSSIIPLYYQEKFLGLLHTLIGKQNAAHDDISLYSWFVQGTKLARTGFDVSHGCTWIVSGWDADFVTSIAKEAMALKEEFLGLRVCAVRTRIEPPQTWQNVSLLAVRYS
jgi:CRISPR/Cas system endoribonuclease Cas6 (RAMP superfamily)